ncbi:hypothetical protein GCM10011390_35230 [Aureimonas endophytica]|uniref:L,D-TPase catalytic domain-containing protein n=1 Tax=Aureimonas endophytica TaxID=2027858 RepID=A0A917E9R5_9HYPH|nr:L,D-transpeptidase family protein [Aureimonas endophytica]GGE13093.1 hypothetical protein GCM10011390_35230 [Aureimonas endophytica]
MSSRPIAALLAAALLGASALAVRAQTAEAPDPGAPAATTSMAPAAQPAAPDLSEAAINGADFAGYEARRKAQVDAARAASDPAKGDPVAAKIATEAPKADPDPFLIRLQVLLDRAHASPGVIDGLAGGNTAKAIRAFGEMHDLNAGDQPSEALWQALGKDAGPAVKTYKITAEDAGGDYVPDLPADYAKLAELKWLGYRDVAEMLAERFHMDEDLLKRLNPDADFGKAGTKLLVAEPGPDPEAERKVERIVVDKSRGELFAYDKEKALILALPATIGSSDTPSPSGTMKVNGSKADPEYEYDPKNFVQGKNRKALTLPPGPNGPVGNMWIDLSKPTYGIHGTPEPSEIDKTASHGCVRLTNWDAHALARLVQPQRTVVEFKG